MIVMWGTFCFSGAEPSRRATYFSPDRGPTKPLFVGRNQTVRSISACGSFQARIGGTTTRRPKSAPKPF